jgi:thiamine biosynthesis lipoprotein
MAALRGARRTGGAVDPTIGGALRRLGYDRDFDLLAPRGPIALQVERVPGWQSIEFDPLGLTLRMPAEVELDLGCTGQAIAGDLAAEAAHEVAGGGVLVGIGGDLRCAGSAPDEGWQVLACEDSRQGPAGPGQTVEVREGALATSSITVRRWQRGDQVFHHLVDPATGRPAEGPLRTATVAGSNCVDANLLATWALIRGDDAMASLRDHQVPARLVRRNGSLLHLGGWPLPFLPEGKVA